MRPRGFAAWARYQFDKSMARGTPALVAWLALGAVAIIVAAAALVAVLIRIGPAGEEPFGFSEAFWASMLRTLDPGTMGQDKGWGIRAVMLVVTLTGIFLVSALIGVLGAGIQTKLAQLRRGRSFVLEEDHTIIFNWSPSIFDVISELIVANESRRRPRIVVMSDHEKAFMEDEIRHRIPNRRNTRIICRSGDPTDLHDLAIVNPEAARSIIVLSPEVEDADSRAIKTILALVHDPARGESRYRIVAELRESKSAELARVVGGSEVQFVLVDELISRIVVQACRQPGLSAVYTELLDFKDCEIYTEDQPGLEGLTFGEALMAYETSSLIGLAQSVERVWLNPPMDTVIAPGMKAIIIAEDEDRIAIRESPVRTGRAPAPGASEPAPPERTLLLGWNRRGPLVAAELSRYVSPGSTLLVAADTPEVERQVRALALPTPNLTLDFRRVDTSKRDQVLALQPASCAHVLVLGYSDHMPPQSADTRTLVTLLHLRAIIEEAGMAVSIVSEMTDVRNRELAEVTRVDDFVVSNKMVSLMLAQVSENPYLEAVFADLLDEEGSEICLRPAANYVETGRTVSFYDVVDAARARGEVAIGHHKGARDARNVGGIQVNPTKSHTFQYEPGDRIIVVARD